MSKKNPAEYGYKADQKVEVDGFIFRETLQVIDLCLQKEMTSTVTEKNKFVTKDDKDFEGEPTKEQLESGEVKKVLDIQGMLSAKPTVQYTQEGQRLLRLYLSYLELHDKNVESGVASHFKDLQKDAEPKMKPVK